MKNYKTAPFDLGKALAGHMLVDGEGEIYKGFHKNGKDGLYAYSAINNNGVMESFSADGDWLRGFSEKQYNLSLYIPLSDKELALQALDEALQTCEAAVNGSSKNDTRKRWDMLNISQGIRQCQKYINSLPALHDICTKIQEHEMTLLDYFAGLNMQGLAASKRGDDLTFGQIASESYHQSAAMMEERKKYLG